LNGYQLSLGRHFRHVEPVGKHPGQEAAYDSPYAYEEALHGKTGGPLF